MYPDDRVLIGVINRKRDFVTVRDEHWYRIPRSRMPDGIHAEYLAFFLSGKVFKEQSGGIHYYARRQGLELVYRRDLLPDEATHKNADEVYYKVQLAPIVGKIPPILNVSHRSISFIHTTWDRFVTARQIANLYSRDDYFVDRIYHVLRDKHIRAQRYWDVAKPEGGYTPQLRILCEQGTVFATTEGSVEDREERLLLDVDQPEDEIFAQIRAAMAAKGGPITLPLPPIR